MFLRLLLGDVFNAIRNSHYYIILLCMCITLYMCDVSFYLFLYWRFAWCWNSCFVLLNLLNWSCVVIQSNVSSDFKCKILFRNSISFSLLFVTVNCEFSHFLFIVALPFAHHLEMLSKIVFCSSYWMMPHSLSCYCVSFNFTNEHWTEWINS